ncbi:MAG: RNA polymerase sigma factor [Ktedonobacterales bacterium]
MLRRDQPPNQRDMTDMTHVGGVSGARGADELAAFCALIDAHATTLTRVATALVGASDAEDAAQEAVVRAWRAWPELRDRAAARAWLISITVNVCRDWLRGRFGARLRLTESLSGAGDESRAIAQLDADPGASDHAAALDLRHAITTLDDDLRVIAARAGAGGLPTALAWATGRAPHWPKRQRSLRNYSCVSAAWGRWMLTTPHDFSHTDRKDRCAICILPVVYEATSAPLPPSSSLD